MMTRKENMLAIYRHEKHDHIGSSMDLAHVGGDAEEFENGPAGGSGGKDWFGMEWARTPSGFGGGTPSPGKVMLPDVKKKKKYVHFPDVTKYDWAGQAKAQLPRVNRETQLVDYGCWNGPFLRLVDMTTMVEGLCALIEEPEACEELLTAITDYRIGTLPYIKKYFDPDIITLYDDFAHERGLFVSPETYRTLIAPQHKRWTDAVRSYGIIPDMHVCGKPEQVVPGFVDEGFEAWQIVQQENDIVSLQREVGDRLAFIGSVKDEVLDAETMACRLLDVPHHSSRVVSTYKDALALCEIPVCSILLRQLENVVNSTCRILVSSSVREAYLLCREVKQLHQQGTLQTCHTPHLQPTYPCL